jgi:di/tricarboxylate transporter
VSAWIWKAEKMENEFTKSPIVSFVLLLMLFLFGGLVEIVLLNIILLCVSRDDRVIVSSVLSNAFFVLGIALILIAFVCHSRREPFQNIERYTKWLIGSGFFLVSSCVFTNLMVLSHQGLAADGELLLARIVVIVFLIVSVPAMYLFARYRTITQKTQGDNPS